MLPIEKKFSPKLKYIFTLLIVAIFSIIFILNSNSVNKEVNKGKNVFEKIISGRSLEEVEKEDKNSTKICEKTSDTLKKYYQTGEKSILGIDDDNIKGKEGEHIEALINLLKINFSKKEKEINDNNRILFELNEFKNEEYLKNIITYGKHILPLIVIFGIAILSFPGWICCICLSCCNCCCCCCCKKPCCKIPSFVFSYIFYGVVALVCFYALGKSDSIFVGIADTECSVLKFVDEVVDGESKENPPYWAGIDKITKILDELSAKVESMKTGTQTTLNDAKTRVDNAKGTFEQNLEDGGNKIKNNCGSAIGCSDYYVTYEKEYQLDMAYKFGEYSYSSKEASPENSICDLWINEYKSTAENAENNFEATQNSFNAILVGASVSESLQKSKQSIKEIKESFDEIKLIIADNIIKNADNIDQYGRLTFRILYSVLILMDAGIAGFMLLLCFCSGRLCNCCCCCRCFCKLFIHILWNLMAICMIGLFLFGSIFTISGKVGEDMISVIAYLVSEENLGENSETILFGDVKKYLNKCFNYNGDIFTELGFDNSMDNFPKLKNAELQLEDIQQEFRDKQKKFVYSEYLEELNNKVAFKSDDLQMVETAPDPDNPSPIKFTELLNYINTKSNDKEKWDITSTSDEICSQADPNLSHDNNIIYHPKKCFPTYKTWGTTDAELNDKLRKLNDFKDLVDLADKDNVDNGIRKIISSLSHDYDEFLKAEIESIGVFKGIIEQITNIVSKVSGEDEGIFSFINCKFIKSNTQILLVNLKNAFGEELYMVGVYLLMAAFSLAFAILFTILLTVILNQNVDQNKRMETKGGEDIPEYPMNSEGRYIRTQK